IFHAERMGGIVRVDQNEPALRFTIDASPLRRIAGLLATELQIANVEPVLESRSVKLQGNKYLTRRKGLIVASRIRRIRTDAGIEAKRFEFVLVEPSRPRIGETIVCVLRRRVLPLQRQRYGAVLIAISTDV